MPLHLDLATEVLGLDADDLRHLVETAHQTGADPILQEVETGEVLLARGADPQIVTLEPVFTAILAYLILGESMNPVQIAGGFLIMTGVVVLRLFGGRKRVQLASISG